VHVIPTPGLQVGDPVTAFQTVIGTTNNWNHIHFKDGYPGNERNALRSGGGLTPFEDPYDPQILTLKFYRNGTQIQFSDAHVSGKVDVISRISEITDTGPYGGNNGSYKIGYEIFDSLGNSIVGPIYPFQFDFIHSSDSYVTNVYAPGSTNGAFFYIVTNNLTYDNWLDVSQWDRGMYTARVYAQDTRQNRDTLTVVFYVVDEDTIPPGTPELLYIRRENNGLKIKWEKNMEGDLKGYRLYFSYDLTNWEVSHNEYILSDTTSELRIPRFPDDLTIYFRLTAVDRAPLPNESEPSTIFPFRKNQNALPVLLMDLFHKRTGYWESSGHPFLANLGETLSQVAVPFNSFSGYGLDDSLLLDYSEYSGSIIYAGDESDTVSQDVVTFMQSFLAEGKGIWLMGTEFLKSLAYNPSGIEFMNSVGVETAELIPPPAVIMGSPSTPFADLSLSVNFVNYSIDSVNRLISISSESIFEDSLGEIYGILTSSDESGDFIYTSLPLEILGTFNQQLELVSTILGSVWDITSIENESFELPGSFILNFYPNPFNSRGTIDLSVPMSGDVQLLFYNILGRLIYEDKKKLQPGEYSFYFPPEIILEQLSSGVYFLKVNL
jgi:hypothetical protein